MKGVGRKAVFAHIVCVPLRDWVCRVGGGRGGSIGGDTYHQWPFTPPIMGKRRRAISGGWFGLEEYRSDQLQSSYMNLN